MIIPRHEYEDMQRHIKSLQAANMTLRAQNDSLSAENQMLIMAAAGSKLDFPNSSKEPMCSGDKIY